MKIFKRDFLIGFLIFALVVILFHYFSKNNIILTAIFLVISIFILLKWTTKEEKIIYFTAFILGPILEITVVPTGIWTYENPTILGIPVWLPLSYGILIIITIKISRGIFGFVSR